MTRSRRSEGDASGGEDERTEEPYLKILLWEFALRFDVTCESGSSDLWEKLHH